MAGKSLGITGHEYRMLNTFEAPCIVYQIRFFLQTSLGPVGSPDIDAIDFFAGLARVQASLTSLGYKAVAYEIKQDV